MVLCHRWEGGGGNHMGGNNYGRELTILDTMRY